MSKNRLGIFLFHDEKGRVYDYVDYLLSDIIKCLDRLIVVSNGFLSDEGRNRFSNYTSDIFERPNVGFDAAGWKEAIINFCGIETVRHFDELVLFNDSFFGPFYPFSNIFNEMDSRKIDFWGLSTHCPAIRENNMVPYEQQPAYIQTYFIVFRKRVLNDPLFEKYWHDLPCFESLPDVIEKHSCVLTRYLEDLGYTWDVYSDAKAPESADKKEDFSCHMLDSCYMVTEKHFPIIRRKCFIIEKEQQLRYGLADSSERALRFIDKHTSYDIRLIWDYLLDNYNLYDIKQNLNLNYVLDSDYSPYSFSGENTAIIAHLYYEDFFKESLDYIKNVPEGTDIYISTNSNSKKSILASLANEMDLHLSDIRVVHNRGRELSALLVGYHDIPLKYKYLCFYHDNKYPQNEFFTVGADFSRLQKMNLLDSTEYINNIIHTFEDNKQLGLLIPPGVYHGTYFSNSRDYWAICFDETRNVLCRLGLYDGLLDQQKPPLSTGTSFWCRSDALRPLFNGDWDIEDFPREPLPGDGTINHAIGRCFPYIAQACHYYTGTVMTSSYAAVEIANFRHMLHAAIMSASGIPGVNFSSFYTFNNSLRKTKYRLKKSPPKEIPLFKNSPPKEILFFLESPPQEIPPFKKACKEITPPVIWHLLKRIKKFYTK